ncbi:UDP-N-acetylmuramoyl-tripeptide--D-alanyl-D-alanine ligase [Lactobacillus sp. DCY120]|uniref:UDP-N-acetylmuramoyl-tripeptide--D-alanyl-D-alanine ligase n=1 Tax=Bombilactobacillus apium TaxID=2675299 RepID=A0A850QZW1_9LACO|nr:UDP-N-acetylmuramoyl-tripeptide--D-alanyl-D-alanine ligase [Bombilactobacillus apium]NVY96329.1 UDP-N-acetylmuramoyl-tripeptide--D-alanyl-D-alanine ligase [Bombilactobacillus apium]
MQMLLTEIRQALGLTTNSQSPTTTEITAVTFDSRKVQAGSLFVPLVAERDGHDFVGAAFQKGAQATLWQADHPLPANADERYLVVSNTLQALQTLSQFYLRKVAPQVVAITGSNGKTTTKDMTAAILAQRYRVVKTPANFNNEIGVPITILSMDSDTEILVVEMGMDRAGQVAKLSALVQPDLAVITMIGEAHIEFFGTRDKIADAKMEIVTALKKRGTFIYNGDEPLLQERAQTVVQAKLTFGQKETNDLYSLTCQGSQKQIRFTTNLWPQLEFCLPLLGDYNVQNALASLLVGQKYQISPEQMQKALATFQPTANRTQWLTAANGSQLLSDVYNANPTAMIDVIANFSQLKTKGRRILVLGDMLELGAQGQKLHQQIATAIDPERIAAVYLIGDLMLSLQTKLAGKLPVYHFASSEQDQLVTQLRQDLDPKDLVLLKASNGLHLDRVVQALQAEC